MASNADQHAVIFLLSKGTLEFRSEVETSGGKR